jgi:hypothetical protein
MRIRTGIVCSSLRMRSHNPLLSTVSILLYVHTSPIGADRELSIRTGQRVVAAVGSGERLASVARYSAFAVSGPHPTFHNELDKTLQSVVH